VLQKAYQLVEFEGNYYFINDGNNRIAKNTKLYLSEKYVTGKTFADGRAIQPGTYEFDAEGKMIIPELKNGVVDDRLYINDVLQKAYQLVEFEGNYYFINGEALTVGRRGYLSEKFVAGTSLLPGYYEFDETGKILLKNGPVDGYFYVNGIRQSGYKLVEFEGNYYFINGEKLTVSRRGYLSEKFVAGTPLKPGYYEFDETGKIILE
jgi:hypothetical protein